MSNRLHCLQFTDDSSAFGRRPVILVCLAILTATSVWCGEAASYNSLLAGRIFQGIGGGAADTLAPDVVGQVFFVHQRGRAMVSQLQLQGRRIQLTATRQSTPSSSLLDLSSADSSVAM